MQLSLPRPDPAAAFAALLEAVVYRARDFDVIHCHVDWLHLPLLRRLGIPFVTTLHGRLDFGYLKNVVRSFRACPFVSISDSQRMPLSELQWAGTVYYGQLVDILTSVYEPQNYLAF